MQLTLETQMLREYGSGLAKQLELKVKLSTEHLVKERARVTTWYHFDACKAEKDEQHALSSHKSQVKNKMGA